MKRILLVLTLLAGACAADPVTLTGWSGYQLYTDDYGATLTDGSWVVLIGSADDTADDMTADSGGLLDPFSTSGDDVVLGTVNTLTLDGLYGGVFETEEISYEADDINYLYVRFFDSQAGWGEEMGEVSWGISTAIEAPNTSPSIPTDLLSRNETTSQTATFAAVPEPLVISFTMLPGLLYVIGRRFFG